ncbi:MAG: hypothetical protein H7144_06485 [Burkholderiales bacterium]|nr:hypothetical protein [Phycisphaerae bacterium]
MGGIGSFPIREIFDLPNLARQFSTAIPEFRGFAMKHGRDFSFDHLRGRIVRERIQ